MTIEFESRVTPPLIPNTLPVTEAFVFKLMEAYASTVPTPTDVVSNVALDPTIQNILQAFAPFVKKICCPALIAKVVAI